MISKKDVQPLYDETGTLQGVFISAHKWQENAPALEKILFSMTSSAPGKTDVIKPEPIKDWETFLSFWDFKYPLEKIVKCDNCGSHTNDWTEDDPKKFTLKAANIGGMVSFQCNCCAYRVTKKHFKDHIKYECSPMTCLIKRA